MDFHKAPHYGVDYETQYLLINAMQKRVNIIDSYTYNFSVAVYVKRGRSHGRACPRRNDAPR